MYVCVCVRYAILPKIIILHMTRVSVRSSCRVDTQCFGSMQNIGLDALNGVFVFTFSFA